MRTLLDRNLEALGTHPLARRLLAGGIPLEVAPLPWPPLPKAPLLFCVGAASPSDLQAALSAGQRIWLWERSAPRLRAFLETEDFSATLQSGQFQLFCGLDLLELELPPGTPVVLHPLLGSRYAVERDWLSRRPARRALVVEGGLLIHELGAALQAQGFGVWTWETSRLPTEELLQIARHYAPERVFAINHLPGLPEIVEQLSAELPGLHLDVWEIDPATAPIQAPTRPVPHTTLYTWRHAQVPVFQAKGYRSTWLPLGSDPEWRHPRTLSAEEQSFYGAPVTFVGRSMLLEARRYQPELIRRIAQVLGDPEEAARIVAQILRAQRETPEVYRIPALLHDAVPGLPAPQAGEADPVQLGGELAAAEFRLTVVANLGRYGAHVWGDEGWKSVERHGVRWRGPAGHQEQVPRIYSNGGIHVDIGRLYQLDIVTLRVFDVLACGGFLLAQHNDNLAQMFVLGEEIDSWRTISELRAKIEYYLERPELRRRIAAAGRARVLRDHTVQQRVRRMLAAEPDSQLS